MPLARIITRSYDEANPLAERLRQQGYTVEIFGPDQLRLSEADLEIDLEVVPVGRALKVAGQRARKHEADVYVDRGVYAERVAPAQPEPISAPPIQLPEPQIVAPPPAATASHPQAPSQDEPEHIAEVLENTFVEVGTALAEARHGIGETLQHERERAHSALSRLRTRFAERRAQRAAQREEEHRLREEERELVRREREAEAARRTLQAEHERRAAEEERRLREQELALRRQRQEEERRQLLAEQQRLAAEHAAAEAERQRIAEETRQAEARQRQEQQPWQPVWTPPPAEAHAGQPARDVDPVAAELAARTRPLPRPRQAPRRRPRHAPSGRQRQWQRAALFASVVALIVMIGFALAMRQSTPFSNSSKMLPAGAVQEQVPFGPATAAPQPVQPAPVRAAAPRRVAPVRPAAAATRRPRRHDGGIAQDEVIVHHYGPQHPAAAKANTTAGVRHYSDMDNQR